MAVATLTEFPDSIVAGDTLRVTLADSDYPSFEWSLRVLFDGPSLKSFTTETGVNDQFDLVVTASDTAKLVPGNYIVTFVYTETLTNERASVIAGTVAVLADPTATPTKTSARIALDNMLAAFEAVSANRELTVNFNGQSCTSLDMADMQDAIARQKAIVASEESGVDLISGTKRPGGIGIRFA